MIECIHDWGQDSFQNFKANLMMLRHVVDVHVTCQTVARGILFLYYWQHWQLKFFPISLKKFYCGIVDSWIGKMSIVKKNCVIFFAFESVTKMEIVFDIARKCQTAMFVYY
jgi:hypothetical protein